MGNELRGKTLGVVGLGSIGREVVKRARAFEMRIVAHDPYVTAKSAHDLGVELVACRGSMPRAITLRCTWPPRRKPRACSRTKRFAQMKTGVRIVNCARGELIDEAALAEAIESGKVAGAALDVFATEPPPPAIRFSRRKRAGHAAHRRVHRRSAGDRGRAHRRAGGGISEKRRRHQCRQYARACRREQYRALGPYMPLAERLGTFAAHMAAGNPKPCGSSTSARSPTATPTCCGTRGWPACSAAPPRNAPTW